MHVSNQNQNRKRIRSASKANSKQATLTTIKAQTAEKVRTKPHLMKQITAAAAAEDRDAYEHSDSSSRRQRCLWASSLSIWMPYAKHLMILIITERQKILSRFSARTEVTEQNYAMAKLHLRVDNSKIYTQIETLYTIKTWRFKNYHQGVQTCLLRLN